MIRLFYTIFLVLFCLMTHAGTIDPKKTDQEYVNYGNKHACVIKLLGHTNDEKNTPYVASCVMISPYYALTAAHVVKGTITQYAIYDGVPHACLIAAIHSDFNSKKMGYNDIAILRFSKPIDLDFYPDLYTDNDEVEKMCSISGFGHTGTLSTGYDRQKDDGKKRAGSNIVNSLEKHLLICSSTDRATSMEFIICPGDSGGGLFINQKLAGINSCVFADDGKTDSDYGDNSGHTRVSIFADWIKESVEKIEEMVKMIQREKLGD